MKTIDFCMSGYAAFKRYGAYKDKHIVYIDMDVDLDKLSPTAKFIAESIWTTDRGDDLSHIRLYGSTRKELAINAGIPEEKIEKEERAFGSNRINSPVTTIWPFDFIKWYETTEEYFERQAKEIKENGWLRIENICGGTIFNIPH